ncbi:MAG: LysM peptidoglycan-binding domain-containing protein [Oscillospiraceae bacterium]
MIIHTVARGESIYSIALQYGASMAQIISDNQLPNPSQLVVGQTLVVQFPSHTHVVKPGETLSAIAASYGLDIRQLLRNNPALQGRDQVYPGQTLVITYQGAPEGSLAVSGYVYPFVDKNLLRRELPYLTLLMPFTYGITSSGGLVGLDDEALISMAISGGVAPMMHLSTLTDEGGFSNELASAVLNDLTVREKLIEAVLQNILKKGYRGLDVDFEFVYPEDADAYAALIRAFSESLAPLGYPVIVALAPKTSANQAGLLYEGHNYKLLGEAADQVLLMTYEWGYTYSAPMAVAPLPNVRKVVEYAITEIPHEKIWLGIPNYGYDWRLPFVAGKSRATSISNQYAVGLAWKYGAEIQYDDKAQVPWFRYFDEQGTEHEVWFEDARSIREKLALVPEYGLFGAGYWNLMRPFPQNWRVLNALYEIQNHS